MDQWSVSFKGILSGDPTLATCESLRVLGRYISVNLEGVSVKADARHIFFFD
jgi:hypothetical protein